MEVYSGQINCQGFYKSRKRSGQSCDGKARYFQNGSYYCGTHSRTCKTTYAVGESKKNERIELMKKPEKNESIKLKQKLKKNESIKLKRKPKKSERIKLKREPKKRRILSSQNKAEVSRKKPHPSSEDLLVYAYQISKVNIAGRSNFSEGQKGRLLISKMETIKDVDYVDGFYPIFPIFRHQNKKYDYGYCCSGLSSMSLGPVNHIMSNLPPAKNLENFFQSAKVFPSEANIHISASNFFENTLSQSDSKRMGRHFRTRIESYMNPIPQRNKYDYSELSSSTGILQYLRDDNIDNKKSLYSIFYSRGGIERRFTTLGSRYFYCRKYEELVKSRPEFKRLKMWINGGINLNILGYGGYFLSLNPNLNQEDLSVRLFEFYIDTDRPFGHVFCLAALLVINNPRNYPWNIMYLISPGTYRGIGI
uniref:Uncharacterized protein n=1 Tax=Pithovirus LCPAC202 TaxID=2506592 RepID=A0A481Z7I9_9VIRU|nr:MAG: uncharacterized protein LCPAC202_03460 [Pithovirus LCPAC202]